MWSENQVAEIAKDNVVVPAPSKLYKHNIVITNTIRQYTCYVTYISTKGKYNTYAEFSNDFPPNSYLPCYGKPLNGGIIITLYNEEYVGISAITVDGNLLNVDDLTNFEDNVTEV